MSKEELILSDNAHFVALMKTLKVNKSDLAIALKKSKPTIKKLWERPSLLTIEDCYNLAEQKEINHVDIVISAMMSLKFKELTQEKTQNA
tara:strand:- start:2796 stop:3065 length:270 start_codon:yes stop_codon:yes gene_type:complete